MKKVIPIFKYNIIIILLFLCIGNISADTTTETLNISDIVTGMGSSNSYDTPDGLFTIQLLGDHTNSSSTIQVNYASEFVIISKKHHLSSVTFSNTESIDGAKVFSDAYNAKFDNTTNIWTATGKTENQMIIAVTGTSTDGKINISGTVTIEYYIAEATVKKTPYIVLDKTSFDAIVNQASFTPPGFQVYEDATKATNITDRFYRNNFIAGQYTDAVFVEDNKAKTKDPVTGTKAARFYNLVEIGDKAGKVNIIIAILPKSDYTDQYNSTNAYYSITIPKITPKVTPTQTTMTIYKGESVTRPSVKVQDETQGIDAKNFFDISYTYTDGIIIGNKEVITATNTVSNDEKITIELTPKTNYNSFNYSKVYEPQTIEIPVSIIEKPSGNISIALTWPDGNTYTDANDNKNLVLPIPRIIETGTGNDVTNLFSLNYVVTDDGGTGSVSMWTANNGIPGTWQMHTGTLASGTITVKVTLGEVRTGYRWNYKKSPAGYNCEYSQCYVQSNKRGLQVSISPNSTTFVQEEDGSIILNKSNFIIPTVTALYNGVKFTNGYTAIALPSTVAFSGSGMKTSMKTISYDGINWNVYRISQIQYANWANWQITYAKTDPKRMLFAAVGWDQAHFDEGGVVEYNVTVTDKITPILTLSSNELIASVGKDFSEPTLYIKDPNGKDIKDKYSLSYSINPTNGVSVSSSGDVSIGTVQQDLKVLITATSTDSKYSSDTISYIIHVITADFSYEIIHESGTTTTVPSTDSLYGKLHFIGAGSMPSGYEIDGVPGLDVKFGNIGDANWKVEVIDNYKYTWNTNQLVIDNNNVPSSGTFYELKPYVNGFITVDANWLANNNYYIQNKDDASDKEIFTPTSKTAGQHKFIYPLIVGNTYYMYNMGSNNTGDFYNEPMQVHGINYYPAYILARTNTEAVSQASTFVNGYTGQLPYVLTNSSDYVSFSISDDKSSSSTDYATIDNNGNITPIKMTTGLTDNSIKIIAKVWAQELGKNVAKTTLYKLSISDIPCYIINDKDNPGVGQQVTTTNIPTDITMTFGGWANGYGPYMKGETKNTSLVDSWQTAKFDYAGLSDVNNVGNHDVTIDGFDYASQGKNNPLDERGNSFDYNNITNGNHSQKELPCRGTYLKFEPRESGTLIVYLLQNGVCNYNGTPSKAGYGTGQQTNAIARRPLFITDETGNAVELDDKWVMDSNLLPSNNNQSEHYGSYTSSLLRCSFRDEDMAKAFGIDNYLKRPDGSWNFEDSITYNEGLANEATVIGQYKDYQADKGTIIKYWESHSVGERQEIIKLTQGYTLISKAYVRYTFQVKAGKTYFVFQLGSKLSPAGFAFVPTNYKSGQEEISDRKNNNATTIDDSKTLSDAGYYTAPSTEQNDYTVTYTNRSFTKGVWSSICLPHSLSETAFDSIFGKDAMIVTCNTIRNDSLILQQHVYHMVVAGCPYLIKPTKDISELTISDVTIETTAYPKIEELNDTFNFVGTFNKETMPAYSYALNGSGVLKRFITNSSPIKGFRAYFKNISNNSEALIKGFAISDANEDNSAGNNIPTAIDDIIYSQDDLTNKTGLYDLQGRKIPSDRNISKGLYINNGKKIIVK